MFILDIDNFNNLNDNYRHDAGMDEYQTTVSIGVVYCGGRSISNYEHVIDQADKAVYAAKDAGRNQIYTVRF